MSYEDEPFFENSYEDGPQDEAEPPRPSRRRRFRAWRRSRPFWGGLFSLLGGLEIALIPLSAYRIILVSHNVALAAVVGAVIAIFGLLMWMTPSQNKLYGLLAILMGGIAVVASNLGGFLMGTILTVLGGALTFAWTELPPEEQPERAEEVRRPPEETAELGDYAESGEEFGARPEDEGSTWDEGPVEEGRPRDEGFTERSWIETR